MVNGESLVCIYMSVWCRGTGVDVLFLREDGPHTGPKHVVALSCSYSDDNVVFLTEYIYIYIYIYIDIQNTFYTSGSRSG
jgi:hypothetical protein